MQRNLVSQERALDTDGFEYDPFSFAVHANPWPYYRVLRRRYPVYRSEKRNFWALSRFDDVRSVARDWHTYSSGSGVELDGAPSLYTELFGPGDFLNLDPEAHDRIRKVVHQGFTPRSINVVGDAIRQRAIALAQRLVERGHGDVAEDFGWKMPLFGICRWSGFQTRTLSSCSVCSSSSFGARQMIRCRMARRPRPAKHSSTSTVCWKSGGRRQGRIF